jgi:hypothetical protein
MRKLICILPVLCSGLLACTSMDFGRSEDSGYADGASAPSAAQDFYRARRSKEWNEAREELNLPHNRELTDQEADDVRARVELNELEGQLSYDQEKKQYYSLKPYFHNDNERIAFLHQPTREAREKWAHVHGVTTDETKFDPVTTNLIDTNDVGKGMSRTAVRQSWGEPDIVEVAGNSLYGNERWKYSKQISTEDGYKLETRVIYFESGRVVGWETLN